MPPQEGHRLAELIPTAEFVGVDDCSTLIPIDQPQRLAAEICRFARRPVRAGHPS